MQQYGSGSIYHTDILPQKVRVFLRGEERAKEKAGPVEEFQWLGLMLFVAVHSVEPVLGQELYNSVHTRHAVLVG